LLQGINNFNLIGKGHEVDDLLKNVWPDWTIIEKLGSGAFGTVYSAKKEEGGRVYESAIKVIHIPQDDDEIRELKNQGMDYQSICKFYKDAKENLGNEISVMEALRTAENIVSIDDYKEMASEDGIGWTMFIRMEKLTSLNKYLENNHIDLYGVVKLGRDMCNALSCCETKHIIHRDIKPDNVFVNGSGDFKLGDFGIARQLEKTQSVRSQKGTYQYMAPEVYRGDKYNHTVDIYSLGIMLYRILNDGRFPFAPPMPHPLHPDDNEKALAERMRGKKLPAPAFITDYRKIKDSGTIKPESLIKLASIVIKACSYQPWARYQSAADMASDLRSLAISNKKSIANLTNSGLGNKENAYGDKSISTIRFMKPLAQNGNDSNGLITNTVKYKFSKKAMETIHGSTKDNTGKSEDNRDHNENTSTNADLPDIGVNMIRQQKVESFNNEVIRKASNASKLIVSRTGNTGQRNTRGGWSCNKTNKRRKGYIGSSRHKRH
jgi:serine/threonine protein kinase